MQRPTSVTVFGILNIGFGVLGIFSLLGTMLVFAMLKDTTNNPMLQLIHNNPGYTAWMHLCVVIGVAARAVLLAAGIGLLKLKPWARTVSIGYGMYEIVMVLVSAVVSYIFLVQPMLEQAHMKQGPEAAGAAIGGAIGGMIGSCFGLIYPVLLLIFMMRANVVAAFRSPAPASGQP